jgi:hypothetical protein
MLYANAAHTRTIAARLSGILRNPRPGVSFRRDWTDAECERIVTVLNARAARTFVVRTYSGLPGYRTDHRST